MKIAIGNDHTALEMKNEMKKFLEEKGYEVIDYGTNSRRAATTRFTEKRWAMQWQTARRIWGSPSAEPA